LLFHVITQGHTGGCAKAVVKINRAEGYTLRNRLQGKIGAEVFVDVGKRRPYCTLIISLGGLSFRARLLPKQEVQKAKKVRMHHQKLILAARFIALAERRKQLVILRRIGYGDVVWAFRKPMAKNIVRQ
jgi:hypothetical protein